MRFPRSSGCLLHITSLPNTWGNDAVHCEDFGVGDLGSAAFEFVDFLKRSGQSIWQVLPLCPTNKGNSPYSCYSAFAGNPVMISVDRLVEAGWLDKTCVSQPEIDGLPKSQVDFEAATRSKQTMLRKAFEQSRQRLALHAPFQAFCQDKAWWLDEFAHFEALMQHLDQPDWTAWPEGLVRRDPVAMEAWGQKLREEIELSKFVQFVFDSQWNQLKSYANENDVRLYGDMPIFVAHESADVWANQELFWLDEQGNPTSVAGVPPDYFSETGQLWGNPLYRWDVMESNDFCWWTGRFRRALEQFDLLRVDHFRGFESYWSIPAGSESAVNGAWQPGPQEKPFEAAASALGDLPIIVEDLGMITQQVHDLRERLAFPPMRVMQFGFANAEDNFHRPDSYPEHCVAYTGTHDNETTMEWFQNQQGQNGLLQEGLNSDEEIHWQLIRMVLASAADTAVIPLQDILGLGAEARMNIPGKPDGNWQWRAEANSLNDQILAYLRNMTESTRRC